jgi:hypothetical protein
MVYYLILIDANGFERQYQHDSLPHTYKVALTKKLVTFDWTSSTTLEIMLNGSHSMRECGYEIKETLFENVGIRDKFGRHIYREIMQ